MEDFVHLHVHTQYSILDGQSKIPHLVDKAIKDGMKGMAVTDHGVMFGIKELTDYCAKVNKDRKKEGLEPFKPIIGCEMYVAHRRKEDRERDKGDMSGYHLIVLAKNYNGYKNLIKLVSNSWVDGYYMRPRTDRADLEKYHEDLIVCSACIAGEVPKKILQGDIEGAREACKWCSKRLTRCSSSLPRSMASNWCVPTMFTSRTRKPPKRTTTCSVSPQARTSTILTVCAIPSRSGLRPVRR